MELASSLMPIQSVTTSSATDIPKLKAVVDKYPYFQGGLFTYLKALYTWHYSGYEEELARLSIFIADREAFFYYIMDEEYGKFRKLNPSQKISADKTSILLDAFFAARNESDVQQSTLEYELNDASLASMDYISYLELQPNCDAKQEIENEASLKHQHIIDSFIERSQNDENFRIKLDENFEDQSESEINNTSNKSDDELTGDIFFTETLAKIYIKQKKYEKAYKIIKHLSLNYPKKNTYFADQLSFIEKLIINSKFKHKK